MDFIKNYFLAFIDLFNEMAPYLLLGLLIAGLLHVYFPAKKLNALLGRKNLKSVVNAALIGVPLPLCSCGVIPTGVSLYKNGASKGSTVSFLISTPQTGVDSILASYALLGLPMAILRPVIAFVTGIFGGVVTNAGDEDDGMEASASAQVETEAIAKNGKLKEAFQYAFVDFLADIAKWLVVGLLLAGLFAVAIPDEFFTKQISNEYLSMLLVLAASIPIYVCATGSIPIAAVLMAKGLSPGAAIVFLMAGPATNAATITVLSKVTDKKTMVAYLFSIIFGAIVSGVIVNEFLPREWFLLPISFMEGHQHAYHFLPEWLSISSSIILALLLLNIFKNHIKNKYFSKPKINTINHSDMNTSIKVKGMTCNHCKMNVEKNLSDIEGIENVEVDLDNAMVNIKGDNIDLNTIKHKVEDIGYEYAGEA